MHPAVERCGRMALIRYLSKKAEHIKRNGNPVRIKVRRMEMQ